MIQTELFKSTRRFKFMCVPRSTKWKNIVGVWVCGMQIYKYAMPDVDMDFEPSHEGHEDAIKATLQVLRAAP